jgi:D-alanine-D-alanine ligase
METVRVGVILGGMSSENEVSLNSGRNVYDNLDRERYVPVPVFMDRDGTLWIIPWQLISQNTTVDISEHLERDARRISYEYLSNEIDFAFIALHGKYGDDGCIQGLLEILRIPYTGSGVLASAIGMDKAMQQKILRGAGLNVPKSMVIAEKDWRSSQVAMTAAVEETFGYPCVTKPTREGSSIGVTLVQGEEYLTGGMEHALAWDTRVLVEEFLDGIEFSCIVMDGHDGPRPLSLTEIHPQSDYYTYDDKYMPGRCRKFTPPKQIPAEAADAIRVEVVKAYKALGFASYGRIDGFYMNDGRILITDPNSSSGMAPSSFFFEQAAEAGMLPSMIITELIEVSRSIHMKKRGPL